MIMHTPDWLLVVIVSLSLLEFDSSVSAQMQKEVNRELVSIIICSGAAVSDYLCL